MSLGLPLDIVEGDEFQARKISFHLLPRLWKEYDKDFDFDWHLVPFTRKSRTSLPRQSGVYSFLLQPSIADHPACSYLVYIGRTNNLWRRFGDYFEVKQKEKGRPKIHRFLCIYDGFVWFCYSKFPEESLDNCEKALLKAFVPPLNCDFPGEISSAVRGAFS